MNKQELVNKVSEITEFTKKDSAKVVDAVFNSIAEELAIGGDIKIAGFGTFSVKERAARKGRNPKTGEEIDIAASKAPVFKSAKALKESVQD